MPAPAAAPMIASAATAAFHPKPDRRGRDGAYSAPDQGGGCLLRGLARPGRRGIARRRRVAGTGTRPEPTRRTWGTGCTRRRNRAPGRPARPRTRPEPQSLPDPQSLPGCTRSPLPVPSLPATAATAATAEAWSVRYPPPMPGRRRRAGARGRRAWRLYHRRLVGHRVLARLRRPRPDRPGISRIGRPGRRHRSGAADPGPADPGAARSWAAPDLPEAGAEATTPTARWPRSRAARTWGAVGQLRQHVGDHPRGRAGVRPVAGLTAEQRRDDRAERARRRRLGRVLVDDRGHGGDRPAALLERAVSLDRRVDGRAERPQVGGWRRVLAADPLGRGEPRRAHHHAGLGELGVVGEGGDAEVGQHGPVVAADQHVARLDVPVHHPGGVRHAQRGKQLPGHLGGAARRQRPRGREHLVERLRVDQLHHDPRTAAVLGHVVDGDHGRVVEPGGGLGLAQRPLEGGGPLLLGEGVGDLHFLDRDVAVEQLITGTPDDTHGTAADGGLQTVTPSDHTPGVRRWVHSRTIHGVG